MSHQGFNGIMEADEKNDYQEEYTERIDAKTNKLSTISMSCMLSVYYATCLYKHNKDFIYSDHSNSKKLCTPETYLMKVCQSRHLRKTLFDFFKK